ncbi:sterol desaturase family protein [Salinivibrio sp. ES.052]|uniref:sterol desaturase family protein n=1 Tax=Salinivibrio sp. ES.052 TaxID=1882823 RepID=UPI00092C7E17|nr:sterol desaturase family protein [Salinivibrio sp. ES.052]SIN73171.1 Sterol desaturase/sphingolipid hydroxylase, fatty acid hydroxylase superfamily [Salinivibrio sp. ES.052]
MNWIETHEAGFRLSLFVLVLVVMLVAEWQWPKRKLTRTRRERWRGNIALTVFNTLTLRLFAPLSAVAIASLVSETGFGLFNQLSLPLWAAVLFTLVLMDMAIWYQHKLFHQVPWLWRLHLVHHADMDIDVTTGARFHTVEIWLSMLIKCTLVAVLGAPVLGVILFETLLSSMAMFNHSNVRLPKHIDVWLRHLIVTPDMHRVHHSTRFHECNANYGFNLSCWDRWFHTYVSQPRKGHHGMRIGLKEISQANDASHIIGMLRLPFRWRILQRAYQNNKESWAHDSSNSHIEKPRQSVRR